MTELDMQEWLTELMLDSIDESNDAVDFDGDDGCQVHSFEEAGLLTRNKGLVIRMPDGSKFQITIVKA